MAHTTHIRHRLRTVLCFLFSCLLLALGGCTGSSLEDARVVVPEDILRRVSLAAFVDPDIVQERITLEDVVAYSHEDFTATTTFGEADPNGPRIAGKLKDGDKAARPYALEFRPVDAKRSAYKLIRIGAAADQHAPTPEDWERILTPFVETAVLDGDITPEFDRFTKDALKEMVRAQMSFYVDHSRFAATIGALTRYGVAEPPYAMPVQVHLANDGATCLMVARHIEGTDIFAVTLPDTTITNSRDDILLAILGAAEADPVEDITPLLFGALDLSTTNRGGKTAIDIASEKAFPSTLRALIDYTPPEN